MSPLLHSWSAKLLAGVVSCVGFLVAGVSIGQQQKTAAPAAKTPQITSVFPAGGQRGASAEISVKGKNLNTVTDLYFSRPVGTIEKIEAKGADQLVATVKIDKDIEPGTLELRAVSGDGMSNLKLFRVDEFPEIAETGEKNDTAAQAQEIKFPSVVNGQLTAADVDFYRFEVKKKQRLVFEVEARRLGSPVEARLRLHDSSGRLLADAATTRAIRPDERLDFEFTEPGSYIVAVEDAQYGGGEGAVYRLRVGSWPYATVMFPLGGRRGEKIEVTLEGGNIAKPVKHKIELPADPNATVFRPQFPGKQGTLVAPMFVALGDETDVMEKEPNDDAKQPQSIAAPCGVNGRIDKPGDKDRYVLAAKKGEKFLVEVYAERLGSWLDSMLIVSDKNGRQIVENDDLRAGNQQQNQQARTGVTPISDSRAEFTASADGEYIITIDDRYNSGGPEYAYRLVVTPSRPDFLLTYGPAPAQKGQPAPKTPQQAPPTDLVNLEPGKSVAVGIAVTRRGFDGEIELSVEGLPEHVTFEPGKVAAKGAAGTVTIKADGDAVTHIGRARVVGTAKINDQETKRVAQSEIIVGQFDQNDRLHVARIELADLALAVIRREQPLAIKVDGEAVLGRGLEAELKIAIERKAGLKGPVEIKLDKLPKGITAEKLTIAENENEGTVKLKSEASAAIAKQKIQIIAQGKLGAATVEAPAEVALAIVPPFELALDPKEKELELVIGEACTLKVAVKRQGNFDGPIELAVTGLPGGVSVMPDKVEPDQDEVELNFVVSDEAKPNKSKKPIKIQATGEIGKQKVKFETAAINVTVKKAE
jgi:hypothetical protein